MKVGDLVTYTGTRSVHYSDSIALVVAVNGDFYQSNELGHLVLYWLKHGSFQGQTKCHHPSNIEKIKQLARERITSLGLNPGSSSGLFDL